jgi:hypothetical protein
MNERHAAAAPHGTLELPPVYSELLSSARRMLQRAESRAWGALLNEEMVFFEAYERVSLMESAPWPEDFTEHRLELREEVHSEVRRHVRRSRELLVKRQAELERELQMERAQSTHAPSAIAMETTPLPV